jgi:Zn finger protein HypA/HybF involved in hydrogenase expression
VDEPRQPDASADVPAERVATARQKFNCPACGGEAHWNPAKHALICPYCGTESPAELQTRDDETVIVEYDLVAALRAIPDSARGWQAEKTSVQCQSCRAISVFDPAKISKNCEFCGSTALVPYEQVKDAFRPESLLPLKIAEPRARELVRAWYRRQWLAPNRFALKALTDTVRGIYLPYWTFDAAVHARWTADSGRYYYTTVNKKPVRHVRWSPAAGELSHVFDDDLVGASTGVHAGLLRAVEPFPTTDLVPYDAGYLSGWMVERYQIDLVAAATRSRQQMDAALREMCARQVPGDTHRNLVVTPTYSGQTFKHILAPIWMLTYVYRGRSFQVVVNGVTGAIAGERPWSWIKIALLVLLAVVVALALMSLQE